MIKNDNMYYKHKQEVHGNSGQDDQELCISLFYEANYESMIGVKYNTGQRIWEVWDLFQSSQKTFRSIFFLVITVTAIEFLWKTWNLQKCAS